MIRGICGRVDMWIYGYVECGERTANVRRDERA